MIANKSQLMLLCIKLNTNLSMCGGEAQIFLKGYKKTMCVQRSTVHPNVPNELGGNDFLLHWKTSEINYNEICLIMENYKNSKNMKNQENFLKTFAYWPSLSHK